MSHSDIMQRMLTLKTDSPDAVNTAINDKLELVAQNFDALVDLLVFDDVTVKAIEDTLPEVLLMRDIKHKWDADEGVAMVRSNASWSMFTPLGFPWKVPTCDIHDVPESLRYPLGMLKLQPNNTAVYACGFKVDDYNYYVLENLKNDDDQTTEG